jgi:hypothetical protein
LETCTKVSNGHGRVQVDDLTRQARSPCARNSIDLSLAFEGHLHIDWTLRDLTIRPTNK